MSIKSAILLLGFLLSWQLVFSQEGSIESVIQKISGEKDDDKRIDIIYHSTAKIGETDPLVGLQYGRKILEYGRNHIDKIAEAYALSYIGKMYMVSGNVEKGLQSALKGKELADGTGNPKLRVISDALLGLVYKNLFNYTKAIDVYKASEKEAARINYPQAQVWAYQSLSEIYLAMDKFDSALLYAQKDYELSLRINYSDFLGYTYINLGNTQAKKRNTSLALSYFDMAIRHSRRYDLPKQLNTALTAKAQYFNGLNQKDSAIRYAKEAIAEVKNTGFELNNVRPAQLLLEIYRDINIDSAFKYSELFRSSRDNVFNAKTILQTQLLTLENEIQEQKLAEEKRKAEEERKQNIQYVLVALGIIVLLILFVLLSRTFITNERVLHFLGIIALLIVFEFFNLLLHPILGSITHHSPALMLLGLVCVGALLVPLHHKAEKWAITRLVEKNRKIRLASAKKTIEELEVNEKQQG